MGVNINFVLVSVACELQKHELIKRLQQQLAEARGERLKQQSVSTTVKADSITEENVCYVYVVENKDHQKL